MKLCRNCRKFNAGEPTRCRYCRAGLVGRVCPRNHVNPIDRQLAFCGECGQPLERECGAGLAVPRIVPIGLRALFVLMVFVAVLSNRQTRVPFFEMLIVCGLLVAGVRFAFGLLPAWVRHLLAAITRWLVQFILGRAIKEKREKR